MERHFDIYVNGAYIGRASGSTCAAIRDREAKRPHMVHGVVLEDSDPPRLVLNPLHDESPALVRRVVEAMSMEPGNLKDAARAFEQAINAQQGIEVSLEHFDQHIISEATPRRRYTVKVTRATTEQVYP